MPGERRIPGEKTRLSDALPASPGSYVLILEATTALRIRIGALGTLALEPGFYAYVGSAFGPGGLRARLGHHLRRTRRPHWHIDSLRRHVTLREIWLAEGARAEHAWAGALARLPSAEMPCLGFGASDCRCPTHLFRFAQRPSPDGLRRSAGSGSLLRSRVVT
ncbi:MAG: GIY-YIG nuclease family protein [bacterium]